MNTRRKRIGHLLAGAVMTAAGAVNTVRRKPWVGLVCLLVAVHCFKASDNDGDE